VTIRVFHFGDFKLDCDRFELCRAGVSVKLERKPMELLILLAAKNGHLVTRDEIAERLWNQEVFVDTEHGINTAIRKIRRVLRDDSEEPRFVQTVPGKGYRFIGSLVESVPSLSSEEESRLSSVERGDVGAAAATAIPGDLQVADDAESPGEGEIPRSSGSRRWVWLAVLGGVGALVFLFIAFLPGARGVGDLSLGRAGGARISSLAVLPLDDLSGDKSQDYFADGMTDELITMLAKNSTLRIVSRTSVMQYKGARRPLREIARELGVDGVLEGSVVRSDDKVHMTIQLIAAPSDTHVWAESYDRSANDVVTLPREAARTIAKRLDSAVLQPALQRYVSPEAHDAYLRGRYIWFSGNNEEAAKYFRKATELQPDYAPGWAGLSTYYGQGALADLNPEDSLARQEEAASKAVELDDSLPWAHLALGAAMFLKWDWVRADQEIARAIEFDPSFAEAYHFRSKMRAALGRREEAIEAEKKAMELDPFARPFAMGLAYFSVRQYDDGISEARLRLETRPEDIGLHWALWESYRRKGSEKEAERELEKFLSLIGLKTAAAGVQRAFEQGGTKAVLRWRLRDLTNQSSKRYVSPVDVATITAQLDRREETLGPLEEGYRQRSPQLLWIQTDPAFDFLHGDERYRSIIRQIGLPAAY
jgi:TolB-like protein/DNA-binding winged helix-turn-helix (wHTH) protein